MTNLQCCVGGYQIQVSSTNHLQTTGTSLKAVSFRYVRLKEVQECTYLQYVKEFTSDFLKEFVKAVCLSAAMFCLFHLLCNSNGIHVFLPALYSCLAPTRFFGVSLEYHVSHWVDVNCSILQLVIVHETEFMCK